jgi:transposase
MNSSNIIAGIDVSKSKLDIHIHPLEHYKIFENNVQSIDEILDFLHLHNVTKFGLEATGGYEKLCAYTLLSNGFEVYIIQPRWVRDYAKSLGITTKTDKIDCSIISRYVNNTDMRVTPLTVGNSNIDCLKQKLSRRNQLVEIAKIEKTQIQQATDTSIIMQIGELLKILRNQIKGLEDEMITFIDQNQEFKGNIYQ